MRIPFLPFLLTMLICISVDIYIYLSARARCRNNTPSRIQLWCSLAIYAVLGIALCIPRRSGSDEELRSVMWILFGFFSIYAPKILFTIIDLTASIPVLWRSKRIKAISAGGAALAVIVFLAMWWGALVNRYRIQVREIEVTVKNLPEVFDGYRMIQFSDIHVGSYGADTAYVSRVVDKINSLDGDVILFTGDIVNRRTDELLPFVRTFSRLKAPDGVFSILGNHDYGDYSSWPTPRHKELNMQLMDSLQAAMGWRLLRNEHEFIYHGNDSIALIGVENVGDPPFTVYGSLPDSYPDLSDNTPKLLMTHNPAHWRQEISDNGNINIALTLAGHTHAMQVELFGVSPAALRYPEWGGMYTDNAGKHYLYVNIGIGTVALPMRVGATPEITAITLRTSK